MSNISSTKKSSPPNSGVSKTQKRILVVDDEEAIRKILVNSLKEEGFLTLEASNGKEAVASTLSNHPDLILLDLLMPEMGGMEALKAIRKDTWGAEVPVIILTNLNADNEDLIEGVVYNKPICYLIKSDWKLHDVVEKVKDVLHTK